MSRLRLPEGPGRFAVVAGVATWLGAFAGWHLGWSAVGGAAGAAVFFTLTGRRLVRVVLAGLVVAGAVSGSLAAARIDATLTANVPEGRVRAEIDVLEDPVTVFGEPRFLGRLRRVEAGSAAPSTPVLVVGDGAAIPVAGTRVVVDGLLRSRPGRLRGDPYAARLTARRIEPMPGTGSALFVAGNALRRRVTAELGPYADRAAGALLAGFLIGDTSGLSDRELDDLRRSGLTHYVAVSGSNVALFLMAWWVVTAPVAMHPRLRGWIGLVGLALFVVVTRWEPSVLRAAAMAGLVLAGRIVSVPVDAWTALGGAAVVLLVVSGDLAASVGFQLSAVATAGVLAGAGMFAGRKPAAVWTALGAAVSAQVAVIPLLLAHFGLVPLLSPVANLLAAPLVTVATSLGGVGVVGGFDVLTAAGVQVAGGVLTISRLAADWPQLGPAAVAGVAAVSLPALRRSWRPFVVAAIAGMLAVANLAPATLPDTATVTVFDVGQGDAVLLRDASGATVLVDAGSDPRLIRSKLRAAGVRRLDLLVATHGDLDHVGGMVGLTGDVAVMRLWLPDQPELGDILPDVAAEVSAGGGEVLRPEPGTIMAAGSFHIEVLGPLRRYQAENDGSLVLWIEAGGATALLPGDIEAVAQRELPRLRPDVMLVPHHGSATSDVEWLTRTLGEVAVVSVGENSYGHPAPEVMALLDASGAQVYVTRDHGDVVVPLAPVASLTPDLPPR